MSPKHTSCSLLESLEAVFGNHLIQILRCYSENKMVKAMTMQQNATYGPSLPACWTRTKQDSLEYSGSVQVVRTKRLLSGGSLETGNIYVCCVLEIPPWTEINLRILHSQCRMFIFIVDAIDLVGFFSRILSNILIQLIAKNTQYAIWWSCATER